MQFNIIKTPHGLIKYEIVNGA